MECTSLMEHLPEVDPPQVFGMDVHAAVEVTKREGSKLLDELTKMQPRAKHTSG